MSQIKLWVGIGAFVLAQTGQVAFTPHGLDLSLGVPPVLAGEGEGEGEGENGEQGEGEQGERGEGEQGEGEGGERSEGGFRRDAPPSEAPRVMPPAESQGGR